MAVVNHLLFNHYIKILIRVRFVFVLIQLAAVLAAKFWWSLPYPILTLFMIVAVNLTINMGFYWRYRQTPNPTMADFFVQLAFDIVSLSVLLFYAGGASNPFISLLLLPVAVGAVVLPKAQLIAISLIALSAYSFLLHSLSPHMMHQMDMKQHFIGMWLNFVLSALVVISVVATIAKTLQAQREKLSRLREEQMRQEQLVALGTSAAQMAHHLATPLATLTMLQEELEETNPHDEALNQQIKYQIERCGQQLDNFRKVAEAVKSNKRTNYLVFEIAAALREETLLLFPECDIQMKVECSTDTFLQTDQTLLPALLNLVQNSVQASRNNGSDKILLRFSVREQSLVLQIQDFGAGISEQALMSLGSELLPSQSGLGMGVLLSHATLNRLNAELRLFNVKPCGAIAEIVFKQTEFSPIVTNNG
ncbi:sensor histidine kinase [Gayadomonas joobiniege]|uniref:sensor histidine kinase n=1 Tax=Gayadomonas joobiniege TaxID=1234606 RepID=UPI00035C3512|nr:HAMP domain-containing sensor histidine kinase [Gayadomonas joobiniege]